MLPSTFDNDPQLRLSKTVLGAFAGSLLAAGFTLTAVLAILVSNPLFRADNLYLPSVTSCAVGLLTVFYDFLISPRYEWTIAATLVTAAAVASTLIYGGLLIWTQRTINVVMKTGLSTGQLDPLRPPSISLRGYDTQAGLLRSKSNSFRGDGTWADTTYYQNYLPNVFPAALPHSKTTYDTEALPEEEQQRQQMLRLLLKQSNNGGWSAGPSDSKASGAAGTYRLDWQDRDIDEPVPPPRHGFYAPGGNSSESELDSGYPTHVAPVELGSSHGGQSWGADVKPRIEPQATRPRSWQEREERRRQIENGLP